MTPLEKLFVLELEYHRKLRCAAPGAPDPEALHTGDALQTGYEALLRGDH
jgi:hypothetical protein